MQFSNSLHILLKWEREETLLGTILSTGDDFIANN